MKEKLSSQVRLGKVMTDSQTSKNLEMRIR